MPTPWLSASRLSYALPRITIPALKHLWRPGEKKGLDHNSGLQGRFRDRAHELEDLADNFKVGSLYLQLFTDSPWGKRLSVAPMNKHYVRITPSGEVDTEGGLYLSAKDLARIGYLFLRNGMSEGRRVVSEEWVRASTSPVVLDIVPDNGREDSDMDTSGGSLTTTETTRRFSREWIRRTSSSSLRNMTLLPCSTAGISMKALGLPHGGLSRSGSFQP